MSENPTTKQLCVLSIPETHPSYINSLLFERFLCIFSLRYIFWCNLQLLFLIFFQSLLLLPHNHLFLLVGNIVILDKFIELIQAFFAVCKSSLGAFILHIFCKGTPIFHNNTSISCVKLQTLFFYIQLLFFMVETLDILVKSVTQKEPIFIDSN